MAVENLGPDLETLIAETIRRAFYEAKSPGNYVRGTTDRFMIDGTFDLQSVAARVMITLKERLIS